MSTPNIHIFTIGHGNRSFEEFLKLLKEFQIQTIIDIRRFPSSRKFPHFNQDPMASLLKAQEIGYLWFKTLGGFRFSEKNESSPNTGLQSPGLRNYADYMMTEEFKISVQNLLTIAQRQVIAVMCAERFYWKCHRWLLSDFLVAQGVVVNHIIEHGNLRPHRLSPYAVVTKNGHLIYPSGPTIVD